MRILTVTVTIAALAACQEYDVKPQVEPVEEPPASEPPPSVPPSIPPSVPTEEPPPSPALEPDIEVSPLALDFGFLPSFCLSDPQVVTVSNVGEADLDVQGIAWLDSSGAFNETGDAVVLAPGESYQFQADFIAPGNGVFTDRIRIISNDPDEPNVDVMAEGTGENGGILSEGFTQNVASQVDVLFVLDNSGSMSGNLDALAQAFPVFINNFVSLGLDYQLGVITTDMDDPAQSGNLIGPLVTSASADPVAEFSALANTGANGSGDEQGLEAAYTALDPTAGLINTTNAGLVRAGSNLSVVVVSDEDDSGSPVGVNNFIGFLNSYQGDPSLTNLSIVGGPKGGFFPCISIVDGISATPVPRYWDVASATGGIHANLCQLDFDVILQQLSTVAAGLRTSYPLQGLPGDPTTITVTISGTSIAPNPTNGWSYDPATNTVHFHGTGVPAEGESVEITYEGETVCPN